MFLSSVLILLTIKGWTPQNSQFCYSPVVIKKYTSNIGKTLYLFNTCSNHFIDMALKKSWRQIIFFAKVFDSRHRKPSYVWVIFLQIFSYFGVRGFSCNNWQKIEIDFMRTYDIDFNLQPTTVNILNNLIQW